MMFRSQFLLKMTHVIGFVVQGHILKVNGDGFGTIWWKYRIIL